MSMVIVMLLSLFLDIYSSVLPFCLYISIDSLYNIDFLFNFEN